LHTAYSTVVHSFPTRRSSDLVFDIRLCGTFENSPTITDGPVMRFSTPALIYGQEEKRNKYWRVLEGLRFRINSILNTHYYALRRDRKSTRLNSSHQIISYAVF